MRLSYRPWCSTALMAALLAPLAGASPHFPSSITSESVSAPANALEDTITGVIEEYDAAYSAYRKASKAAVTEEERKAASTLYPMADKYGERLIVLANAAPESQEALEAVTWVLDHRVAGARLASCLELVQTHHKDKEETGQLCLSLSRNTEPEVQTFLTALSEASSDANVRGKATYALAGVLGSQVNLAERLKGADEDTRKSFRGYYSEGVVDLALTLDVAVLNQQREELLLLASAKYADIELRGRTLGQAAESDLFELRNLQVGKSAPDITGEDLDGVEFKLSDYRGKVVFLDFWGNW